MAAPWFKLYSKELLADSKILQLEDDQLGKLLKLWAFANEDGFIPADPATLSKLLRLANAKQMVKQMDWVLKFFRTMEGDPSRLISLRLLAEQQAYEEKVQKLKQNGSKGGRPHKANGKQLVFKNEPNGLANQIQMGPEVGSRKKEEEKDRTPSESCANPASQASAPPASPTVLEIPCCGKGPSSYAVTSAMLAQWGDSFPGVDALREAKRMQFWIQANPTRRKTFKGMGRFIGTWLSKAQDSGRSSPMAVGASHSPAHRRDVDEAGIQTIKTKFAEVASVSTGAEDLF